MKKARKSKGFTLAELLIVVAIIGILLAVAIPNVLSYYRSMKLTELDDSARTIFMAAQNRLTAMKNAGEDLNKLSDIDVKENLSSGIGAGKYIAVTSDQPGFASLVPGGSIESQLHDNHYVVEIDPKNGAVYAVWYWEEEDFNYESNAYISVKPDKDKRLDAGQMVGYYGGAFIDRLTIGQTPLPSAQIINAEELKLEITIPGGSGSSAPAINATVTLSDSSGHKVTIIKEAKLVYDSGPANCYSGTIVLDTLDESKYDGEGTTNFTSGKPKGMKFKNWKDVDTSKTDTITPGANFDIEITVTAVDSGADPVNYLPQYIYLSDVNSLFAGLDDGGTTALIEYGRHLQNLDADTSGVTESITGAVQTRDINFALHNKSGEDKDNIYFWANTYPDDSEDTNLGEDKILDLHPLSNTYLTSYDGRGYEIRNMSTTGRDGWGGLFSAIYSADFSFKNVTLVNPYIHASGDSASAGGLAGSAFMNVKIDNCQVYNEYDAAKDDPEGVRELCDAHSVNLDSLVFKTTSSGEMYAEKLLGVPHISAPEDEGNCSAGGLIGFAFGNVEITDSFASVIVIGEWFAGGLIGNAGGDVSINSSYSGSYVYFNHHGAGLVGRVTPNGNEISITDSYAAGEVISGFGHNTPVGAGFFTFPDEKGSGVVEFESFKVTNCYSAVRFAGGVNNYNRFLSSFNENTSRYPTTKTIEKVFYVKQNGYNDRGVDEDGNTAKSAGTAVTTAELTAMITALDTPFFSTAWNTGADKTNVLSDTHAYNLLTETEDLPDVYPYPMLKGTGDAVMPHYGDWLENKANGSLVNWEQYPASAGTPEYGFWGLLGNGGVVQTINNLKRGDLSNNDLEYAVADGYGVLVAQDASGNSTAPDVTIETSTGETKVDFSTASSLLEKGVYTDGSVKYDLYKIPYTAPTIAPAAYYTAVTVNGSTFWYNPDFACEVFERREGDTAPAEPQEKQDAEGDPTGAASSTTKGVVIRTARQLANLPVYTKAELNKDNAAQLRAYTQLLDIDYGEYEGIKDEIKDKPQPPAALTKTDDNSEYGSYDGNHFVIKNLFINGGSNVGLFGQLNLADKTTGVRNVFLVDVTVTGTGDNVGALVGSAGGSTVIDHCGVYVSPEKYTTCTVTGKQTVGGLIGMMGSSTTVQNSFAAVQVSGTTYVGGFAGQINGNRELANCYSGGYTRDGQYKADTANVTATDITNGIAGGFAGRMINYNNTDDKPTSLKLSGVLYSTCSAKGHTVGLLIGQFNEKNGTASSGEEYQSFRDKFSDPAAGLTLYATGTAFNNAGDPMTSGLNEETYLTTGNAIPRGALTVADTYNYDTPTLDNAAYPYATNLTEHHGDWVTYPMAAYIEKYQIGTTTEYGAYAASVNGDGAVEATLNTLKSQGAMGDACVIDDFYRILSPQELTTTFELDKGTATPAVTGTLSLDVDNFGTAGTIKINGQTYYVYKFVEVADVMDKATEISTDYYHSLDLGNYIFYFNTHFGLEIYDVTANASTAKDKILEKPEAAGKKDDDVVKFVVPDGTGTKETDTATGVVIRSARQLANMQAYTNDSTTGTTAQGWTYDQLLDVNFTKYNDNVPGKTAPGLAPAALTTGAFDGHGNLIVNLYIGPGAADGTGYAPAGLFGTVTGGEVRHVRLVNIDLDLKGKGGENSSAIGGLIGRLENGTVNDCGIYVDEKLAGTTPLETLYTSRKVTGSGENGVGGLIGQIQNGTVSNSFAAVKVEGTGVAAAPAINPVGGFVGQMNGGTIENCYVGGYVDAASKTYVADTVNVSGNNNVGGFVGSIAVSGINFNGINYSTASVYGPDANTIGLFAGAGSISKPTGADNNLYALAKAFTDETDTAGVTTTVVTAARDESAYLSNPQIVRNTNETGKHFDTFHYNRGTDVYPYQTATDQTEHHGDWIGLTKGVYYDTVGTATGYYTNGDNMSGAVPLASRPPVGVAYATDDGYMFLSETDLGDVALGINGATFMLEQKKDAVTGVPVKETVGTKEYYVYYVPADALNTMPVDAYYFTVSVNGQLFTANFAFAGEIFDYGTVTDMTTPMKKTLLTEGAAIRTPRQLANAGIWTSRSEASGAIARGLQYEQLLDIDYDEYIKISETKMPKIYAENKDNNGDDIPYNHVPITLSGSSAGYEGNGCTIRGLLPGYLLDKDSSGTFALNGLFGRVKGANISNVNLINARVVGYADNKAVAQLDETGGTSTSSLPLGGEPMTIASGDVMVASDDPYVLESKDLSATSSLTSKLNCGTGNLFTILPKTSGDKIDSDSSNSHTWDDESGYSVAKNANRISFNGAVKTSQCSIKFQIDNTAKVKIWWVCRNVSGVIEIIDASGNQAAMSKHKPDLTKDKAYYDELDLTSSGTYYVGASTGGIYIYKIEVIVGGGGGTVTPPGPGPTEPSGENGVNETLLAKGILAPMGHGIEISTSAKVRVGALAGILDGATVTDSGAYVEATKTETDPAHDTADKAYNYYIVKNEIAGSEDAVGGFAGNVAGNSKITGCFSAAKVIGVQTAGGFAGKLGGTTVVTNCYVGGHTVKGTYLKIGTDLKHSEYYVNVSTTAKDKIAYTGGFVGKINGSDVTFSGINYTTASVGMAYNTVGKDGEKDTAISTIGQFAGTGAPKTDTTVTTQLYASGSIFRKVVDVDKVETEDKNGYETFPQGTAAGFKSKKYTVDGKDTTYDFFPVRNDEDTYLTQAALVGNPQPTNAEETRYDTSLGNNYPYPTAETQKVHHGDWTERFQFIYYEVYDYNYIGDNVKKIGEASDINEAIGFYAVLRGDGTDKRVVNTLKTDKLVRDSGYMILADSENTGILFTISAFYGDKQNSGKSTYLSTEEAIKGDSISDQKGNKIANYLYVIPFESINLAPSTTYYNRVTINGQPYMLNAQFACEAVNVDLTKTEDGKEVFDYDTIRSKPELEYLEAETADGKLKLDSDGSVVMKKGTPGFAEGSVIIRNPWNLAGMARLTRAGNDDETAMKNAQKYTFHLLLDVDYGTASDGKPAYADGKRIFDGNTNARGEKGTDNEYHQWYSGTKDGMGQVAANLAGGTFEGHGHTIKNIYLGSDRLADEDVGLFGELTNKSTVQNVVLENVNVNAYGSGKAVVGTIASEVDGGSTVKNVIIKGLTMDFHYKETADFAANNRKPITIEQVGGIIGKLASGTVENVSVSGVKIDFDSGTGSVNAKENTPINIGGAIGEIDGSASGAKVLVKDVYVVNPSIQANNTFKSDYSGQGDIVGGVIGKADGGTYNVSSFDSATSRNITIENAGVYVDHTADSTVADNDAAYNKFTVEATDNGKDALTGGFAGRTDPFVKLVNCFAAVKVTGGDYVGGFAGDIQGSYVMNCYSGGHTEGGDYPSEANVTGSNHVGGFAGRMERKDSALALEGILYSTCSVSNTNTSSENIGVFQGTKENVSSVEGVVDKASSASATLFATGKVIVGGTALDESDYLCTSSKILWPEGKVPTGFTTSPYDQKLIDKVKDGQAFPYRTNLNEHHGDWVEIPVASSLCYYEVYGTDSYGVWGYLGPTAAVPVNTLKKGTPNDDDLECALSDGYGVLVKKGELVPEHVTVDGKTFNLDTTTPLAKDEDIDGEQYDLYKIDTTGITSSTYYNKITVDKTDYWFNPFFACEVQKPGTDITSAEPMAKLGAAGEDDTGTYDGKVVIRTARQLAEMAKQTGSEGIDDPTTDEEKTKQAAQLRDYVQLLDINFDGFDDNYTPAALWRTKDSSNKVTASGSYDGNEFSISNLHITGTGNNVGLFGVLGTGGHEKDSTVVGDTDSGLIQNITLIDITVKGDGKNRVGALAGDVKNSTIIRNCGVYASNAEAYENCTITGKDYVGGLIGQVGSSTIIKNCFAAVKVTGENYVGGFAGQINGSKGMENCYSGGHTNGGEYTEANVTATSGSAGSFVGKLMNYQNDKDGTPDKPNDFVFSGVLYSTCSVSGKADKTGLFAGEVADWTEIPASNKNNSGEKGTAIKPVLEDITVYSTGVALVGTARAEDYLKDLNKVWDESENNLTAHPYDTDNLAEDGFHYESGFDDHYGDWVEPSTPAVQAAGIAYVEVYGSGEIGLQIVGYVKNGSVVVEINDRNVIDTLNYGKDAPLSTVSTYYVTFTTDDSTCSVDELGFVAGSEDDDGDITSAIINAFMETSDLTKGDLSTLKATLYDTTDVAIEGASENAAVNIDGDSKTLYYTVGLAGVSYDTFGEEDNPFRIRTAQQLDNIPDNVENDTYFRQTHDISGEEGYYGAAEFAGHFDGRGYRIQDLTSGATQDTCTGLFKSLSTGAEISNVVLYTKGSQMSGDNALTIDTNDPELLSFGGIANTASGTVSLTNCAVVGYDTTFDLSDDDVTEFYYGGLIGEVASDSTTTITNCAAINDVTLDVGTERNNQLGYYHGGLVGKIAGSLILKNCYTGGTDTIAGMGGGGLGSTTLADKAGAFGLTGEIDGGSVTANYCYSWAFDGVNNSKISVAPLGADEFTDSAQNYCLSDTTSATTDATRKTYDQFLANNGDPLLTGSTTTDFGEAASSHPIGSGTYDDFPFPEVIQEIDENGDPTGTFVHYGDWPSDATSGPEFGLFLIYGDHPNAYNNSGNSDAYAVAVMFDENGPSSYEQSRKGTTAAGVQNLTYYWGFAIRNANNSKLQVIKDNLTVEFYNTYVEGKTNTPTHTFTFNDAETKANDKFNNDSDFNGYLRFISKDTNKLTEADLAALAGTSSRIIVKYGDTEIATFNWSKLVRNPTKTSDPGIPEGPSFEVAMAPAVTEAIVPEKFKLPESEDIDENDDDGHTQIVDRRMSVARVRRVR